MKNNELLKNIFMTYNHSPGTQKSYVYALKQYCQYFGMDLHDCFRSHMLRRFHASALYNDGMSLNDVNDLQGKSKNRTDQTYFMINPENLKYEYIEHLPAVTINTEVKKLHVKSHEFFKIENKKTNLKVN